MIDVNRMKLLAQQMRRALELFAASITDESAMMEIADVYPEYSAGKPYKTGDIFRWGTNADGETQLWQVLQGHTSATHWPPNEAVSLYKAIGFTAEGYSIWTQPLGATDAYQEGDIVEYEGSLWISTCANNVWAPGVYGWESYSA